MAIIDMFSRKTVTETNPTTPTTEENPIIVDATTTPTTEAPTTEAPTTAGSTPAEAKTGRLRAFRTALANRLHRQPKPAVTVVPEPAPAATAGSTPAAEPVVEWVDANEMLLAKLTEASLLRGAVLDLPAAAQEALLPEATDLWKTLIDEVSKTLVASAFSTPEMTARYTVLNERLEALDQKVDQAQDAAAKAAKAERKAQRKANSKIRKVSRAVFITAPKAVGHAIMVPLRALGRLFTRTAAAATPATPPPAAAAA